MTLEKTLIDLEALKSLRAKELKALNLKVAQVLRIKQLKDDILKLDSDITTAQKKVAVEEK